MIKLFMNEKEIGLNTVWYHYKSNVIDPYYYSLSIELLPNQDIISFIEKFTNSPIINDRISSLIIEKDEQKGSLGLIWNLFMIFKKKKKLYTNDVPITWTLNNIKHVKVENGFLIISGEASDNYGIDAVSVS